MESSVLLTVLLLLIHLTAGQLLQLSLGSSCQDGWVCTTADKCTALGDLRISRPQLCSFTSDGNPIFCCPSNTPSSRSSKAEQICQRYKSKVCSSNRILTQVNAEMKSRSLLPFTEPDVWSVVGGYQVQSRTHQHMALIGYGDSQSSAEWLCGGSIISNNFILTAAHCLKDNAGQIAKWVRVGDLDTSSSSDDARPEVLGVSQKILHPNYKPPALYNDIALFRLERPLTFNAWVGPACLFTERVIPDSHATVTGWGRTDFVGETSSHLLAVDVPLVDPKECRSLLRATSRIPDGINTDSMICAGEKEGGKDACSGDSGGPLVINSTTSFCLKMQIGIISFGRMCALPNTPGVYTRIHHFLPWIESIVWP